MTQATLSDTSYVNSNLFARFYLDDQIKALDEWECDEDAEGARRELLSLWEAEGEVIEGHNEDALIDAWIDEVLETLGFGTTPEVALTETRGFVDSLLFTSDEQRRDAAGVYLDSDDERDLFSRGSAILEAKRWDADFNARFNEQRPYRDASHQIKHYLEKTPPQIEWGILTNGRKWRLYGSRDYETETYYEVDLPELLESGTLEDFKYFYVLFRSAAFETVAGETFLDRVWSESEIAMQELGADLQDNVFTALRVLGRGFIETNDLTIDPDDEEALSELKEQSLVLLYRLMFVLYAESRNLINPDDQEAQSVYNENFSLDQIRRDIFEKIEDGQTLDQAYTKHTTQMWTRLEDLFSLIDEGEDELGIPPYNGGLFNEDDHHFLSEHGVSNRHLAEVIYRLSTTRGREEQPVLANYADLDTRHLGSIYEGLLEHEFQIAEEDYAAVREDDAEKWKPATEVTVSEAVETVPEGGLYVVNDDGERKATGSYYTPDYIVTYIVEETVGPLVDEIEADLEQTDLEPGTDDYVVAFWEAVSDLKVLDPAMGSGHFLTKATGYLSEQVMSRVRELETATVFDEEWIRRHIAKECIYGVDLNSMAVELAKLSMWLETLAADQPLAFLDHHLKEGNSLVGSDVEQIEELESDIIETSDQSSLAEFGGTRRGTIDRVMDRYKEFLAIENENIEDVREMKRKYAEIEEDFLRQRLILMLNVHTAESFGVNLPSGAYERMAKSLESDSKWAEVEELDWFKTAQNLCSQYNFLHWKLEFPEVFYDEDGNKLEDDGFDVVVGNPPWVGTRTGIMDDETDTYLRNTFTSASGQFDLAAVFLEQAVAIVEDENSVGFVIPKRIATNESYEALRKTLAKDRHLHTAIDLGVAFEGVNNDALIIITDGEADEFTTYGERVGRQKIETWETPSDYIDAMPFSIYPVNSSPDAVRLVDKIVDASVSQLGAYVSIDRGAECGMNHSAISKEQVGDSQAIVDHLDVGPYAINHSGHYVDLDSISENELKSTDIYTETPKLLVRFLAPEWTVAIDDYGYFSTNLVYHVQCSGHEDYICAYMSSNLINFWYFTAFQNDEIKFPHVQQSHIEAIPLAGVLSEEIEESSAVEHTVFSEEDVSEMLAYDGDDPISVYDALSLATEVQIEHYESKNSINTDLMDYIVGYSDGSTLSNMGLYQPPQTASTDSILYATKEDYTKLQIGEMDLERRGSDTIVVTATARYKPENSETFETDQYGYTETESIEAFRVTDLSELEASLIEAFVPVAVDELGSDAEYRKKATKTNSLVDRMKAIQLPDIDDLEDDLQHYIDAKSRKDAVEAKIADVDELVDQIVYSLYDLTEEEIEVVEESVG